MIEVIEHRFWQHAASGRTASVYGAGPCWGDPAAQGWQVVTRGWTWRDNDNGTVGLCRVAVATREEAEAVAREINAKRAAARAQHERDWAPVNAPVVWTRREANDGATIWTSGEGYTVRKVDGWHFCEDIDDTPDLPAFRALAKAKDWCDRCIRSERAARRFAA